MSQAQTADSTDRSASPLRYSHRNENPNRTGRCEPNFAGSAGRTGPVVQKVGHHEAQQTRLSRPRLADHDGKITVGQPLVAGAAGHLQAAQFVLCPTARQQAVHGGDGVTVGPVSVHADGLFHLRRSCRTWAGRAGQTMPVSALVRQGLLTRSARLAAEELTAAVGDVQHHVFKRLERVWTRAEPAGPPLRSRIRVLTDELQERGFSVYGAMWAAALIAAAFTADGPRTAVEAALDRVPPRCRLARTVRRAASLYDAGVTWPDALDQLERETSGLPWIHTVPNAAVLTAGLLYGAGDFTTTITLTVRGGLDTDSNGATAGSVAGVLCGAAAIPPQWTEPLQDRIRSAVFGFDAARISDLAARTHRLALRA